MKRWVVKAGSNIICSGGPLLIRSWMQQVAALREDERIEVIWVTSGAIASAGTRTRFARDRNSLAQKQALSAIGQPIVMDLYNLSLQAVGLLGAQVLLTSDDLKDEARTRNFQNTLEQLLKWKVTPVLNENDAVATEEIRFGDNDSLSAKVACTMQADRLVILTDVNGFYNSDPRGNPRARLMKQIQGVSEATLKKLKPEAGTDLGTGGMYSKMLAARLAGEKGIETWLAHGETPSVLLKIARDESVGTRVLPHVVAKGGKNGGK